MVLTFWYSFLFSIVLIYFTHFHRSPQKSHQPSILHSLRSNSFRKLFGEQDFASLESLQKRFSGLSISRVFRTIVGEESSREYVEDIVISGEEADVNKLLANTTILNGDTEVEVKLIRQVNVPVTATVDATTQEYDNINHTVKPTPPPLVHGYENILDGGVS